MEGLKEDQNFNLQAVKYHHQQTIELKKQNKQLQELVDSLQRRIQEQDNMISNHSKTISLFIDLLRRII